MSLRASTRSGAVLAGMEHATKRYPGRERIPALLGHQAVEHSSRQMLKAILTEPRAPPCNGRRDSPEGLADR